MEVKKLDDPAFGKEQHGRYSLVEAGQAEVPVRRRIGPWQTKTASRRMGRP